MYSDSVRRYGQPQSYTALFPSASEQAFATYAETFHDLGHITFVAGTIVTAEDVREEAGLLGDTSYDSALWGWIKAAQTHVAAILGFPVLSGLRTDYYTGFAERDYHGSRLVLARLSYVTESDGTNPIQDVFYLDEDNVKRSIASTNWILDRHASLGSYGRNRQAIVFTEKPNSSTALLDADGDAVENSEGDELFTVLSKQISLPVGVSYDAGVSNTPEGNEAVRAAVLLIALDLAGRDPKDMENTPSVSSWRQAERLLEPHKQSLFGLDLPDAVEEERGYASGPYNPILGVGRY